MKKECKIPKCNNILTNLAYGLCCSKKCDDILGSIEKEILKSYVGFKGSDLHLIIALKDTINLKLNEL